MADFAAGSWNMKESNNFDEYMQAVGVGFVLRKMGNTLKPSQEITVDGDNWKIKTISTFKTTEVNFKLGEEFDENTADGRNVKTTMSLEGKKLTGVQKGDIDSVISREWEGDTMTMTLKAKDVTCTRIYKRAE